jgi:hypothetical protein
MKAKPPAKKPGVPTGTRNLGQPGGFVMDVQRRGRVAGRVRG